MDHAIGAFLRSPWTVIIVCVAVLGFVAYAATLPWRANREARLPEDES